MLERVIANLCANAIEAMERNGGKIEISLLHNDKTVWIEVADTGKGIPENLLDRVFDSGSTFGKKNGTGLGLSFCKKIVMAHGGKVSVYSREGEGTVFSLVFPLAAVLKTEWLEVGDRLGLKTVLFCDACECDKWVYDFYDEKLAGLTSVSEIHSKNASDNQAEFTLDPL
jgi:anti-sigma regulatory factor (Ser/Thr protein kinase)